ncbi:MAG: cytochrome o ubiquinol oxidase subunit IV [Caulobacteraceae bacterium]|nr:cytochrome o ubiquinol oxidase subunit IV [Caulobacteraceae bacterium]
MTAHDHSHPVAHEADHGSRRSYLIGFLLAAVLTAIPFWLAMSGVLEGRITAIVVTVLALVQIVVHTVFFLHVNTRSEGGWTLLTLVFTAIIVVIVILGSLWIMYHLHGNMMPMAPQPPPPPA